MYPNFYFLVKDIFGVEVTGLVFVNTFGFFVAMGFLVANYFMIQEFKRKEEQGLILPQVLKVKVGGKASMVELAVNAAVGFLIGWKFVYLIVNSGEFFDDPQSHILSSEGSVPLGILVAIIAAGWKYIEAARIAKKYPKRTEIKQVHHPHQLMGGITLVAALFGFIFYHYAIKQGNIAIFMGFQFLVIVALTETISLIISKVLSKLEG